MHIRLILKIVEETPDYVKFQIVEQTLRNLKFNESCPRFDPRNFFLSSQGGPEIQTDCLFVRGSSDSPSSNNKILRAGKPGTWDRIKHAVLQYNQHNSKNTLTEADVIWTQGQKQ